MTATSVFEVSFFELTSLIKLAKFQFSNQDFSIDTNACRSYRQ